MTAPGADRRFIAGAEELNARLKVRYDGLACRLQFRKPDQFHEDFWLPLINH